MQEHTVKVKLLAVREDTYTKYVFGDNKGNYIMCTKPPNWNTPTVKVGEDGFLKYREVFAGDRYCDEELLEGFYRYSAIYFVDFVRLNDNVTTEEIIL